VTANFLAEIERVNAIVASWEAFLLPTAMHPTFDPARSGALWPHGNQEIYSAYDRIFDCRRHGWLNLQSAHLNLPFAGDDEFARLHAAVRAVLPLIAGLAASSPMVEGRLTGAMDNRLQVYRVNQVRVPEITGDVIPEPIYSRRAYQTEVLEPMYRAIGAFDPDGILQHEWLNSRGAIARFDRNAIEIRVCDVQETPRADLAVALLVSETLRALVEERWGSWSSLAALPSAPLAVLFDRVALDADAAVVDHPDLLRLLGLTETRASVGEVWTHLAESLLLVPRSERAGIRAALWTILRHGPLARRIVRSLGRTPRPDRIREVYGALAGCLANDTMFVDVPR
jgi:hypothetical protein